MLLKKLSDEIKQTIGDNVFAIAIAPSNTIHFMKDIKAHLNSVFPNVIDISECFSKINGFEAGVINAVLNKEELRNRIALDINCFNQKMTEDITHFLLVDDVYSLGNTFNAMKLVISEVDNTKIIITAAILKTSNE